MLCKSIDISEQKLRKASTKDLQRLARFMGVDDNEEGLIDRLLVSVNSTQPSRNDADGLVEITYQNQTANLMLERKELS